jgi:two-component system response regulator FixJ
MSQKSGTVLIVDDDAAVRSSLKFSLELEGLDVRVYEGSAAFLADPDLPLSSCLVVDYRMPEMDGMELVESLRARHNALPAILITGRATKALRLRAEKAGVQHVLEKPLAGGALAASIRAALGNCR